VTAAVPWRKRLSHRAKALLYAIDPLDAFLDARLARPTGPIGSALRERAYLRLFPERSVRRSPLERSPRALSRRAAVLALVPPEDTGGGSRPAQIAAELLRRGFAIEWTYSLPVFPWPRGLRPHVPGVAVRHVSDPPAAPRPPADLCLVEAPDPRLLAELARRPRPKALVYDAIDLWDGSLGAGWYDRGAEARAIAGADALVASSELLRDELAERSGRRVALVPNAVDLDLFDPTRPQPRPADVRPGRPTILYVGALWGDWVDVELIAAVARGLPSSEVHLLGPTGGRRLPSLANLHVLGPRPQTDVPSYIAAADVAIIPFAPSRIARAVSPLKLFEYLAMGIPVVSTPLPEVASLAEVTVAADPAGFVAAVAAARRAEVRPAALRERLREHGWAARVDRLLDAAGLPPAVAATDAGP
jgi:glycosyltransferase involved in cell wall biosynthesis